MSNLTLKVVTPQRTVLDRDDVEMVLAPGAEGELGILPNHAPLLSKLKQGIIKYRVGGKNHYIGLEGGFLEVSSNKVAILADKAIFPEEADLLRAEDARRLAKEQLEKKLEGTDFVKVEAELRKALLELKLLEYAGK